MGKAQKPPDTEVTVETLIDVLVQSICTLIKTIQLVQEMAIDQESLVERLLGAEVNMDEAIDALGEFCFGNFHFF